MSRAWVLIFSIVLQHLTGWECVGCTGPGASQTPGRETCCAGSKQESCCGTTGQETRKGVGGCGGCEDQPKTPAAKTGHCDPAEAIPCACNATQCVVQPAMGTAQTERTTGGAHQFKSKAGEHAPINPALSAAALWASERVRVRDWARNLGPAQGAGQRCALLCVWTI